MTDITRIVETEFKWFEAIEYFFDQCNKYAEAELNVKKNEKEANGGFIELGKNDDPYENPFKKRDLGKKLEKEK